MVKFRYSLQVAGCQL